MTGEINQANESLAAAVASNAKLTSDIQSVNAKFDASQQELQATKNELEETKDQLQETETTLQSTSDKLTIAQSNLESVKTDLSAAQQSLTDTRSELTSTRSRLKTTESLNSQMRNQYADLRDTINARWDWKEYATDYVTPDNATVAEKAHYLAGDFTNVAEDIWTDYNRFYNWVSSTIEYQTDSLSPIMPHALGQMVKWCHDCWKTPEETLTDMTGDCEDMATLLASLMIAYNQDSYAVWVIGIENDDSAHVAVGFPVTGGKFTILDPAGHYFTGMNTWGLLTAEPIEQSISNWLRHWAFDMPGARINLVFSDDFYREFTSTQGFIDWVKSR